jgi:2-oxoacid:acceptor oxidoreductase delta subunit (pyruvate/2-ketoisovalerate family)
MPELSPWSDVRAGGTVVPGDVDQPRTGGWRTGLKPEVDLSACVNCLLCWLYCPDTAVRIEDGTFLGFDEDYCKGCELCAAVCPTGAVRMVRDEH